MTSADKVRHIPVLIAGGGPVGLTLAAVLAQRGIRCMVVERNLSTTIHPKMDITNARSMELFRSLGLVEALRRVAVPEDHCFDVSWISSFTGEELHRFRYPSVVEHRRQIRARNDGSQPAESPMRVSQVEIEPVLKRHIENSPLVDVRFGVEFLDLRQDGDGVTATIRDVHTGSTEDIRADYLAGCDGGSSKVRHCLGISLSGEARTMQRFMVHFKSPRKDLLMRWGPAWHYQSAYGTLIAQNDEDLWTLHARFPQGATIDSFDPSELITKFVGQAIEHEVLVANPWVPHLLVADAYQQGRVFLVGDAAHQYIPTGGYGMNTGVCEAFDLGWKIAAVLQGFGGPGLLDAYERERRPVALRNCAAARRHNDVRVRIAELYTPELFAQGEAGQRARQHASQHIAAIGNAENESEGIEWGYAYTDSPIVAYEPHSQWQDDPLHYHPSALPGSRLPSVFLPDGSALYDQLGPWFTLLLTRPMPSDVMQAFRTAADSMHVPLKILDLNAPALAPLYAAEAVLIRPDQHVAWRGAAQQTTAQATAILSKALGLAAT